MHTLEDLKTGKLTGVRKLQLAANLSEIPPEILNLASSLEYLDLSGNQLSALPPTFARLQKLKIVFFSDNKFTQFPPVLGSLPNLEMIGFKACQIKEVPENSLPENLRWLILTNNYITELPQSIGKCLRLQKLMLAGNKLKALPSEMAACQNLELVRLAANELTQLPEWLFSLPRLSWLAFAGNPISQPDEYNTNLPQISWSDLELAAPLGQGASGVIYKANWNSGEQVKKAVAVKLFKGEVTSDGLPTDEMMASLISGKHPNLIPALGKINGHPKQKQGLVFDLIPTYYQNLGLPPSLESCTRDCYPENTVFSLNQLLTIATGIASVAKHLHTTGILHGDLYAHNILINPDVENADPLLGDFGAATLLKPSDLTRSGLLEKIEVRAFGCLLEDLLNYLSEPDKRVECIVYLNSLKSACMQKDISSRPDFNTILREIENISD